MISKIRTYKSGPITKNYILCFIAFNDIIRRYLYVLLEKSKI